MTSPISDAERFDAVFATINPSGVPLAVVDVKNEAATSSSIAAATNMGPDNKPNPNFQALSLETATGIEAHKGAGVWYRAHDYIELYRAGDGRVQAAFSSSLVANALETVVTKPLSYDPVPPQSRQLAVGSALLAMEQAVQHLLED